tara:strand:+ start:10793 stop:11485 length:693 start_codon:yes stop_codon:yes gene_type:complete
MSVTEKLMAQGSFNLKLDYNKVPNSILNTIDAWDNIVIVPQRVEENELNDTAMLSSADYVGVVTGLALGDDAVEIEGAGLGIYLGDSDNRGLPISDQGSVSDMRKYKNKSLQYVLDNHTDGSPFGLLRDGSDGGQRAIRAGTITNPSKESTDLLYNFEGNNGDTTTTDATKRDHKSEFYGQAKISNAQAKNGSTSLYLDGDRSYVEVDYSYHFQLESDDFTIEWWEYREA